MPNPFQKLRNIPMKHRPTETIHVLAEQPVPEGGESSAPSPDASRFNRLSPLAIGIYIFLGLSLIVYGIGIASPVFSDWVNRYISAGIRAVTATLTGWIPFSLAETLLLFLPVIIISLIIIAVRMRCATWRQVLVFTGNLLALVAFLLALFLLSFGIAYRGTPLENKLGLDRKPVSVDELESTAIILQEKIHETVDSVTFRNQDFSVMPYSLAELNDKLLTAYDKVDDELTFLPSLRSRVKPVINSEVMSHAHITGVYTYFTGEANLNMVFPDYTLPFTAAHELAHQRGIAREDEANFIAFLVCIASDDPYIQYSAYVNMFEYVGSALSGVDSARYQTIFGQLDRRVFYEEVAYSAFYDKYRHSKLSEVSSVVNDTYLQIQGTPGEQSYGMVVDLAVAYYKAKAN